MKQVIQFTWLGQGGARFQYRETVIYLDPYLSNSVQELDAPDLIRQTPIKIRPEEVTDADWVLITHEHIDHCDPHTIPLLAKASPQACFVTTEAVGQILIDWGIPISRIKQTSNEWLNLNDSISIFPTPAAHPKIIKNTAGHYQQIGFVIKFEERLFYIAGDTFLCDELFDVLKSLPAIETAFLPVNEHNYFRGKRGIIGNMSVRDALNLALELGFERMIPVHWDMFQINSAHPEEIVILHKKIAPELELMMPIPFEVIEI